MTQTRTQTPNRAATFLPGDPICDALFTGKRGFAAQNKQFREGPIEFLPGHFSNDWPFLIFKKKLAADLTKHFPRTVDEWGRVSGNGIRSNFYGLQHVNGFPMRPATFPLADNRLLRTKANLLNEFEKPWHKVALIALVRLFCTSLEPVPLRLRKGSSSMLPFFDTNMEKKKEISTNALLTGRQSAEWMMKGDYQRAWIQNQCGGAYQTVYRRQSSDAITYESGVWKAKDRPVADLEFALTGGAAGTYVPSSKMLGEVDFKVPEGFFRERNRTAQGGPLGMNAVLMPIAQAVRNRVYDVYSYTFHHTTREQMQTDLRSWKFSIAADVSNHDQFWPTFILEAIVEGMQAEGLQEWWTHLYRVKSALPLYVTDVDEGKGNILIGDWRKPDLHSGLPSGNAFTDLEGTWLMTWVYFLVMVEHTLPAIIPQLSDVASAMQVWDSFLKGKLPICMKDKSDDALLGWTDPAYIPKAKILMQKLKDGIQVSKYMKISYEDGGAFLGNVLLYPASGAFEGMVLIGNGVSLPVNQFSPEYGVQSGVKDRSRVKRPFPGLAWETLPTVYGSCPAYGGIMELIEKHWYDVYHESYRGMREALLVADTERLADYVSQNAIKLSLFDLTAIDREVLADPDKLQYKFLPTDVSPGVLEMLFQGLTLKEVEPFFRSAYSG